MASSSPALGPQNSAALQQQINVAQARMRTGANWFIIIGALSVVNTLISMGGGRIRFIFGLGITEFADAIAQHSGSVNQALPLVLSVLFGGFVAMFGFFGRKEQSWAFYVGMGLYVCDGLLLLPVGQYLDAAFHAWALFRIFQGVQGLNALAALRRQALENVGTTSTSWER
jgi:hypothetical protein